jgi:anti-sigma regulatory factor (Ser/Thr protein kinase)
MVTTGSRYHRVFRGQPDQVSGVRQAIRQHARNTPVADDVVLIASELAANAVLHSKSRDETFAIMCEVFPHCVRIAVADLGGEWHRPGPDGRPHGLDIVARLATTWGVRPGTEGSRVVWARVEFGEA